MAVHCPKYILCAMSHSNLIKETPMNDWDFVNFSQDHELNRHLELVNKSQSQDNRAYLRNTTQVTAKTALDKTVITHGEFKPFVKADKDHLDDPR